MKSRYPLRPLGDVIHLDRDEVPVESTVSYRLAGMYSFGRGVLEREPMNGSEMSYRSLFRLHEGTLVMSRLNAWEGAVAVVTGEHDGCFVSNEYPTFSLDQSQILSSYLALLCRWPQLWEALRERARGMGSDVGARRLRVHPEQLLATEVPLPDIEEQRRIVTWLDGLLHRQKVVQSAIQTHSADVVVQALPPLVGGELQTAATGVTTISELVKLVGDVVHPGDDPGGARQFVGLQHVESHTGRRLGAGPVGNEKGRKFRFEPGDVVYGYLRPYLNKAWVADRSGLCSVDQYVLRPTGRMSSSLIGYVLRSVGVLQQARVLTHNLQLPRLRSGLLMAMSAPDVPLERQAVTESRLDAMSNRICAMAGARRRQGEAVDALGRAALNRAFAGITS